MAIPNKNVSSGKVIYDFGMHNGSDIGYYLKKGFRVVGVEANPALFDRCAKQWESEIKASRLTVLNAAISPSCDASVTDFYIKKSDWLLSQLHHPGEASISEFEKITIPQISASSVIEKYGQPHYVKIDLEGIDHEILAEIFDRKIYPDFISAEYHSISVFCQLVSAGYASFKLLNGASISKDYADAEIITPVGRERVSFEAHSAGPFGDDLMGPWLNPDAFFFLLANEGVGWKDIHASRVTSSSEVSSLAMRRRLNFLDYISDIGPSLIRAIGSRVMRYGRRN